MYMCICSDEDQCIFFGLSDSDTSIHGKKLSDTDTPIQYDALSNTNNVTRITDTLRH